MNTPTPTIPDLARRLIAIEAARAPGEGAAAGAVRACDNMRLLLVKLAGAAGFRSLMTRALALAVAEIPSLGSVQVRADGALVGFEAAVDRLSGDEADAAGAAVLARLLGLLVTFIGEPLTRQLVCDAWPDTPWTRPIGEPGGQS